MNQKEEKILKYLSSHYDEDKSTLIKHSLKDLYEDLKDREEIRTFEKKEKSGKVKFVTAAEMLKSF